MNVLENVKIYGVWGWKDFNLSFKPDVNFLIGVNGTGKTTVIQIIASALTADFRSLSSLPFNRIFLKLSEINGKRKPSIEIIKANQKTPDNMKIKIKEKSNAKPSILYTKESLEGIYFLHKKRKRLIDKQAGLFVDYTDHYIRPEMIRRYTNVKWLSLQRAAFEEKRSNRDFESTVDLKIEELSTSFIKYFSQLSKKATEEISEFQKKIFVALIELQRTAVRGRDIESEKQALVEMYKALGVEEDKFLEPVRKHFNILKKALEKKADLSIDEWYAVIGAGKINYIVTEWNELIKKQEIIFKPQTTFLNILRYLSKDKKYHINSKNELVATTKQDNLLSLKKLSSGEKQLLIFLGEALLQEKTNWIYIADEPELSLHIEWQDVLVDNLRKLNPNAQIIFATHSPDIVGNYSKNAIDLEKV